MRRFIDKIVQGDALTVISELPDDFVDCVLTSPPYWGLRDYEIEPLIWDEDKSCHHEWIVTENIKSGSFCWKCSAWQGSLGLEATLELYLKHLCCIFEEVKRVLKKTGSCWVNLGVVMASKGAERFDKREYGGKNALYGGRGRTNTYPAKCDCMIPERFAIEMINRGWIKRRTIIWQKPNCLPSSVKDDFTLDFEYLYRFVKSKRYHFEQQFEPYTKPMNRWGGERLKANGESIWDKGTGQSTYRDRSMRPTPQGRNKRCVWAISTKPLKGAHFATFPEELCETPILSTCPEGGVVLDPFCGAGTVCLVAAKLRRHYIGIDIKAEYCAMARERLSSQPLVY